MPQQFESDLIRFNWACLNGKAEKAYILITMTGRLEPI